MPKLLALLLVLSAVAPLPGCAISDQDKAAREWQRSECNRINDSEDRERCLKRL